jgi:arylsulfatase A
MAPGNPRPSSGVIAYFHEQGRVLQSFTLQHDLPRRPVPAVEGDAMPIQPEVNVGSCLRYSLRQFLRRALALVMVVANLARGGSQAVAEQRGESATRPNFVVILVDDLGYADVGPFGSQHRTPQLDRMAIEGRKLTSHYAAPVCSPSRAALLTGCYPKRTLPIPHVLFPAAAAGLHPDETTIAEVLKSAGYATACIGKWHLGDQAEFLPTRQGFDSYFGLPYSNDMGPAADGAKSNPGAPIPQTKQAIEAVTKTKNTADEGTGRKGAGQPPLPLLENDKVVGRVRAEEQFELTRRYTERAVQFIHDHADGPFFLYLPHTAVHFPLYPSAKFQGKSANGLLGDWVEEVDWSVGQVLAALRERNLAENTLVIFTSDNGGPLVHGGNNTPLRGGKGQTFEGGVRVATLAWWPGKIPAGTHTAAMTSMMDLLPTFAKLAGATPPSGRKLDGVDVSSVLFGDPAAPPRNEFFFFRGFQLEAVRSGPWKLHLELAVGPTTAGKPERRPQLFDLANDIGEAHDVAAERPDVVKQLQALAETMSGDLGRIEIGPGCRPLGNVTNPQPLIADDGTVRADAVGPAKQFP